MVDQFARVIIRTGGIGIILSILGIFVFLVAQAIPLFFSPTGSLTRQIDVGTTSTDFPQATLVGIDDHQSLSYVLTPDTLSFRQLPSGNAYPVTLPTALAVANITAVARMTGATQRVALGTDDGHIIPMRIRFRSVFDDTGTRETIPKVTVEPALTIDPTHATLIRLAYQNGDDGISAIVLNNQGHLWYGAFRSLDPGYESTQPPVDLSPHITVKNHGGSAERAVGDQDLAPPQRVVDEFVPVQDRDRIGARFTVLHHAHHDVLIAPFALAGGLRLGDNVRDPFTLSASPSLLIPLRASRPDERKRPE